MPKPTAKVVVEQNPDAPIEKGVLAKAIIDISNAATALAKSGLNRKAIVLLIAHSSSQYQNTVARVLDALESLKKDYCQ